MRPEKESEASSSAPRHQHATMPGAIPGSFTKHEHGPDSSHDDPKGEEGGIKEAAGELYEVVHRASRPLPTETGDGTYVTNDHEGTSLWTDIRALGLEDVSTIKDIIETTARGPEVDDKTMLMERIIRVIAIFPPASPYQRS